MQNKGISTNRQHSKEVIGKTLKSLAAGGALTASITADNLDALLNQHLLKIKEKDIDPGRLASYLKQQKLISAQRVEDGQVEVMITLAGWRRVQKYTLDNLEIEQPKSWNEHWHMVMFDIPEKHKSARNALSAKLKKLGFSQWQRSVWVYPYECESEIMTIAQVFGIDQYVTYGVIQHTNAAPQLLRQFAHLVSY